MRRSRALLIGPLIIVSAACGLIADLGDRTLKADGADASERTDSGGEEDAAVLPPPDATGQPSFCSGFTLYASFDTKLSGDVNGPITIVQGDVSQVAEGKFGGGALLAEQDGGARNVTGGALFFLAAEGGVIYPEDKGSLAVWYRPQPTTPARSPVLYRPVATMPDAGPLRTAGLAFYLRGEYDEPLTGFYQQVLDGGEDDRIQQPFFVFGAEEVRPWLQSASFNHFFTAWDRTSTTATALVALNGGLGVAYQDGGQAYPDAAGSNGELRVPYRGFTKLPWASQGRPLALRLGGNGANDPRGIYDDLVVWNRVLSFTEVAELYSSGKAFGELCGLR